MKGEEDLLLEAIHVIESLWPTDHVLDVAARSIITRLPDGQVAIVSSVDGAVLWAGGQLLGLPWAVAMWTAAKKVAEDRAKSHRKG